MNILGITAFRGPSAACLVRDHKVIAAAREDRFSGHSRDRDFPVHSINYCLRAGKISAADLDRAAVVGTEDSWREFTPSMEEVQPGSNSWWRRFSRMVGRRHDVARVIATELDPSVEVEFVPELKAHVASGIAATPVERAAILVLDWRSLVSGSLDPDLGVRLSPPRPHEWRSGSDLTGAARRLVDRALELRHETEAEHLIVAGPEANRPELVGVLHRAEIFHSLWVHPAAGAGADAIGAALHASGAGGKRPVAGIAGYGPDYNSHQIRTFLRSRQLFPQELDRDDVLPEIVARLSRGQRIGWFQGRLELTDRTMASRSVLRSPAHGEYDSSETLLVPSERLATVFENADGAPQSGSDLILRNEWDSTFGDPDRPKRPRAYYAVDREANRQLHEVLVTFREATGLPALLGRPFRRSGAPVACTPADAYEASATAGVDAVALGRHLLDAQGAASQTPALTEASSSREIE